MSQSYESLLIWDSNLHMWWFARVCVVAGLNILSMSVCACGCVCCSAERSLHPETDEYFPLVCWLLNWLLGKCLSSTLPWQGQDFLCVYVSAAWGVFYTSRHMRHSELWLIHNPAIKALWVRGLCLPVAFDRCVSSNCQISVTAALRVPVESLS